MIRVYLGDFKINNLIVPILYPNLKLKIKDNFVFMKKAFDFLQKPLVDLVDDPGSADFIMIPYNYFSIKENIAYLKNFENIADKYEKKIIVFAYGDSPEEVKVRNSIVFRTSQYRTELKNNEIMMPGYVEDLGLLAGINYRNKQNMAVVGFCGWADFVNLKQSILYYLKSLFYYRKEKKQGLYFRRKAIRKLINSGLVKTNFILRKTYSGHSKTIGLSPEKARSEYIQNIKESDFTLVVKGDGNFSYRFYEVLSLGRIPLFLDTDCVLPLEDIIDYKQFICFVDYKRLSTMGRIIADYYKDFTNKEFEAKQVHARKVFEDYLRIDKFFEIMFLNKKIYNYIR